MIDTMRILGMFILTAWSIALVLQITAFIAEYLPGIFVAIIIACVLTYKMS